MILYFVFFRRLVMIEELMLFDMVMIMWVLVGVLLKFRLMGKCFVDVVMVFI